MLFSCTPVQETAMQRTTWKLSSSWLGLVINQVESWARQACSGISDEKEVRADLPAARANHKQSRWIASLISHSVTPGNLTFKPPRLLVQELHCLSCMSFFPPSFWPLLPPSALSLLLLCPRLNPPGV